MATKNLKHSLRSSKFEKHTMHGVSKCKNKRCGECNIIMTVKSYTFEKPRTTFIISKDLSSNSKIAVYLIKYTNCK